MAAPRRLTRSHDRKIAGVCGGLADYFDIDPTIVRVLFVLAVFVPPVGLTIVLAYIVLWLIMPAPTGEPATPSTIDLGGSAPDSALILGVILLGAGVVFLFGSLGFSGFWWGGSWFGLHFLRLFWPALLIGLGLLVIMSSRRNA